MPLDHPISLSLRLVFDVWMCRNHFEMDRLSNEPGLSSECAVPWSVRSLKAAVWMPLYGRLSLLPCNSLPSSHCPRLSSLLPTADKFAWGYSAKIPLSPHTIPYRSISTATATSTMTAQFWGLFAWGHLFLARQWSNDSFMPRECEYAIGSKPN